MSKKSTPGPSYGGPRHGKISQNALPVTLFKQLPWAEIGLKFKNFCAHQIANDQTIVLSPDNVQKVYSRPKYSHNDEGYQSYYYYWGDVTMFLNTTWIPALAWLTLNIIPILLLVILSNVTNLDIFLKLPDIIVKLRAKRET